MSNADNSRSSAEILPISGRDSSGRFTAGAGNVGRAVGSKNRVSNEALQAVRDMKDEAIQQLREKLAAGDWNALQFILERILPKGRLVEIDAASPQAITTALASGSLTTGEAKDLASVLEKLASIEAISALNERLEALEAIANAK